MVGQVKDQGSDIEQKVESLKARQVGEKQHNKGLGKQGIKSHANKNKYLEIGVFIKILFFKTDFF